MPYYRMYYRTTLRIIREYPDDVMKQSHLTYIRKEYRTPTKKLQLPSFATREQEAYVGYLVALKCLLYQRMYLRKHGIQPKKLPQCIAHLD